MTVSCSVKRVTLAWPAPTSRAASAESRSNAAGPGTSTSSRRALAMRCGSRRTSDVEGTGWAATRDLPSDSVGGERANWLHPGPVGHAVTPAGTERNRPPEERPAALPRTGERHRPHLHERPGRTDALPMPASRLLALPDCRPLLASPEDLTLAFQPIVDLAGATVAGYEALARFPGSAGPDVWFAAAADAGVAAELEALAIHKALAVVPALPADTFLTVNVSPHLLGSAPVQAAFATRPALQRVVVELTEHTPVHDLAALRRQTDELRARGALIALDDAGSGYSGLQLAVLRPQVVKLDRALVSDADTDPVRVALAEMLGEFAGRIDA